VKERQVRILITTRQDA